MSAAGLGSDSTWDSFLLLVRRCFQACQPDGLACGIFMSTGGYQYVLSILSNNKYLVYIVSRSIEQCVKTSMCTSPLCRSMPRSDICQIPRGETILESQRFCCVIHTVMILQSWRWPLSCLKQFHAACAGVTTVAPAISTPPARHFRLG